MIDKKIIFIFISEEGYGHTIRLCSILNELNKLRNNIEIHIFAGSHISLLETRLTCPVQIHTINSGLLLRKKSNCSLDIPTTLSTLVDWKNQVENWRSQILNIQSKCDLIISDSVPQAASLAKFYNCKSINISHFTWDWMYSEIRKKSLSNLNLSPDLDNSIELMKELYDLYDFFIFPPLTPLTNLDLLQQRSRKNIDIEYILSDSFIDSYYSESFLNLLNPKLPKLLLMNNGTFSLTQCINKIISNWQDDYKINLLVMPAELNQEALSKIITCNTIYPLQTISQAHSAMTEVDFFLARCGYNTLSESIFTNSEPILVSEELNPEIESNLNYAIQNGLKVIRPKEVNIENIISIIKISTAKDSLIKSKQDFSQKDLVKGRKECAEIILSFLV